mmetsp:Transcript_52279/g.87249  ORF Transcript_52279/g.87249 Transcript_52279/m.87249 type:complete len:232 (+) Transcript_52279:3623-4318(+)
MWGMLWLDQPVSFGTVFHQRGMHSIIQGLGSDVCKISIFQLCGQFQTDFGSMCDDGGLGSAVHHPKLHFAALRAHVDEHSAGDLLLLMLMRVAKQHKSGLILWELVYQLLDGDGVSNAASKINFVAFYCHYRSTDAAVTEPPHGLGRSVADQSLNAMYIRLRGANGDLLLVQLVPHFLFICPRIVCRRIYLALDLGLQRSPQQCILLGAMDGVGHLMCAQCLSHSFHRSSV